MRKFIYSKLRGFFLQRDMSDEESRIIFLSLYWRFVFIISLLSLVIQRNRGNNVW